MFKKLLCLIFGHRLPVSDWYGSGLYGRKKQGATDNLGRIRFSISHECSRCKAEYVAAEFAVATATTWTIFDIDQAGEGFFITIVKGQYWSFCGSKESAIYYLNHGYKKVFGPIPAPPEDE